MLVATFGPATGWHGREIIWDVDHFILVGHGAITPAALLDYDRQGFLQWASPELRPWAVSVSQWAAQPTGQTPAAWYAPGPERAPGAAQAPSATPAKPGGFPRWALIVIILGVVAVVLAIVLAVMIPAFVLRTTETIANDAAVRSGARSIQTGLESWAAEHAGAYPDATSVNSVGLSRYITAWPVNPYTGMPMSPGASPGCFSYEVGSGGGTYRLIAYGRDGTVVLDLRGGGGGTI